MTVYNSMNSKKSNNEGQFVKKAAKVWLGLWLGPSAKDSSLGTQSVRTRSQKAGSCENCHLYLSHLLLLPVGSKEGNSDKKLFQVRLHSTSFAM